MAKRFTDTEKWKKPWFRGLPGAYKHLWNYILDTCDHAGIWYVDLELASFCIDEPVNGATALELFEKQIVVLNGGSRWFIQDFIEFQYGSLTTNNNMHRSVIALLRKYNLPYKSAPDQPLTSPTPGAKDKDKDKKDVKPLGDRVVGKGEFEQLWAKYPRRLGKKESERHFLASVKTMQDFLDIQNALDNYMIQLRKDGTAENYILHGKTWFNNWRDYVNYRGVVFRERPQAPAPQPRPPDAEISDEDRQEGAKVFQYLREKLKGKAIPR